MLQQIANTLWIVTILGWLAFWFSSRKLVHARRRWQVVAVDIGIGFVWALNINEYEWPLAAPFMPEIAPARWFGLLLTLAGLGLAIWARLYLGRSWSAGNAIREGQQLFRTGPFAIVRHPIYAGFMLATLGTALISNDWEGLFAFALIVLLWGYKAWLEEDFLRQHFGEEYGLYMQQVGGLIPRSLSRNRH